MISSIGDELRISPLRYEFPRETSGDDANWIVVRGEVRLAQGRSWSFDNPCMETMDLPKVEQWLRGVADGTVGPRGWDHYSEDDPIHPVLDFLEPNLAFRLAERAGERCVVEVAFFLESHPERSRDERFHLRLDMAIQEVERAADEWHQEREAFPPRGLYRG
ncbi:MAG TPA: hypothetical protein VIC58_05595 [Actinomycetota bacterium]